MSLTISTTNQKLYILEEQSAWGTAIADGSMLTIIDCEAMTVDRDIKELRLPRNDGTRNPTAGEVYQHQGLSMPVAVIKGVARHELLDKLLYGVFQQVSEGATTPHAKTYTPPDSSPDFTADAGMFFTFGEYSASANNAGTKLHDCIVRNLKLTISPGDILRYEAELISRNTAATSFNPSGSLVHVADAFWPYATASGIARFTMNDGTSFDLTLFGDIEIEMANEIVGVGLDSGVFESFVVTKRMAYLRATVLNDANAYRLYAARAAASGGTLCTARLGWGNATAGTTDADLDFTGPCKITECTDPNEDGVSTVQFTAEFVADISASNAHITAVLANATDRSW
jgi:hypothetical protein